MPRGRGRHWDVEVREGRRWRLYDTYDQQGDAEAVAERLLRDQDVDDARVLLVERRLVWSRNAS